jgi:hypothetical protein
MKSLMAPNIPLAIVFLAAVAAIALRAVTRRPEMPATGPAPVTVMTGQSQSQAPVTACRHDGTGGEMARPPAPPGRPGSAVDQAQHIFHELHADGRNTLCAVCDLQYGAALRHPLTEPVAGDRFRWARSACYRARAAGPAVTALKMSSAGWGG